MNPFLTVASIGIWKWWEANPSLTLAHLQEEMRSKGRKLSFVACKGEHATGADGKPRTYVLSIHTQPAEARKKMASEGIDEATNMERLRDCGFLDVYNPSPLRCEKCKVYVREGEDAHDCTKE